MWQFEGPLRRCRSRVTRRDVLQVGTRAVAGLSLTEILRLQSRADATARNSVRNGNSVRKEKSVILVWLRGGPSHIDSVDMKPEAPSEIRGEFQPIATNVPGIQVCEHLPLLAGMADKFAIVRGIRSNDIGDHTPHYIMTGTPNRGTRPAFGSVVSHLHNRASTLPPYVSLMYEPPKLYDNEGPLYLGPAHRPFAPRDEGLANLSLVREVSSDRLRDRKQLLAAFDSRRRELDTESMSAVDDFTRQALEIVTSSKARDAFDLSRETEATRLRYGKFCESFLTARRLAEAGVSVVTLKVGDWDTHEKNFIDMRTQLPQLDRGLRALLTDLYDRGLDQDVAVVLWGEFGRAPRISRGDGRDHWPEAGAALVAGGGFRVGQTIGETEADGGRAKSRPYTPSNLLSTLYRHLGIDPATTLPDHNGRPIHLLDDREVVRELI